MKRNKRKRKYARRTPIAEVALRIGQSRGMMDPPSLTNTQRLKNALTNIQTSLAELNTLL